MLREHIEAPEVKIGIAPDWRASEVGECETYLWHIKVGSEPLPLTGRIGHLFADGVTHERDIVDRLVGAGFGVRRSYLDGQAEVHPSPTRPRVLGYPDGVLDVPGKLRGMELDYWDDRFRRNEQFYLLEITAPNHFTFLRIKREHLREVLWRKFVQIQMYLNSEEIKSYTYCNVAIVKNKNTSELYEEGISYDSGVVELTFEKLMRIEELASRGVMPDFRCHDWRQHTCRYRHICYAVEEDRRGVFVSEVLEGESLKESEELSEAAKVWKAGKDLVDQGSEGVDGARSIFEAVIREYGARGLTIAGLKALLVSSSRRKTDLDKLEANFLDAYKEVVSTYSLESLRVTK